MATVTKPMALDETLQGTNNTISTQNSKLDTMNTKLQAIVDAIGSSSLIGDTDISGIADGTITGAIAGLDSGKVDKTSLGANNGVAQLDSTGKVPSSQLPSFVDDVLEYASASAFPTTGESGKIYVALDTNKTYRWGGTSYVVISETLALGETQDTAYRGDRGKIAYDHSQDANRVTTATAVGLYKVGATAEGHISGLTPIQKSDLTGVGLVGSVTDSTTNGNIVVDGVEVQVYDDTDVQNDIDAIEDELSTGTQTLEGNPINFTTKSAQNAKSTILSVEPIQDLHGYDKPWVGGAGKNLWNNGDVSGTQYETVNLNNPLGVGTYTFSAVVTSSDIDADTCRIYDYTNAIELGQIARSVSGSRVSITFTTSNPISTVLLYASNGFSAGAGDTFSFKDIQLELGSTATSYEPYSNICPISGRTEIGILGCGKNLLEAVESGGINASNGSKFNESTRCRISDMLLLKANTNYVLTGYTKVTGKTLQIGYETWDHYGFGGNTIKVDSGWLSPNISLLFTEDTWFTCIYRYSDNSKISYTDITSQLEKGNQSSSYEPYTESNDLTISLGQTVYGGTLDVENGVLVVDRVGKDLGTLTWTKQTTITGSYRFYSNAGAIQSRVYGANEKPNAICDCYEPLTANEVWNGKIGLSIAGTLGETYFAICDTNYADATAFTNGMNGVMAAYELATPITINLTPHTIKLLEGVNNISTDGDKITLTYRDGSVATLGDLTSAVDNLDSKIDESKILTDTATGDKYILVVTNGVLSVEQISN